MTMTQPPVARRILRVALQLGAISLSALLLGVYAGGGSAYLLGFVALVPWLLSLHTTRSWSLALFSGWVMATAFVAAVFGWFGAAFGAYVGVSHFSALLTLLVLAPVLQPQILSYALVRHWAQRHHGPALSALAGAAAWVACEWAWPKLLGDTLGHGLHPSASLRQLADLGGAAGLSLALILFNEAVALALLRARLGTRAVLGPLAAAGIMVVLMLGYGSWRLANVQAAQAQPAASIRIGLIQANISGYEALRKQIGSHGVVRHVLDTHFAMSTHAIREQGAEALLWSETVYPTTFGQPKSDDGAEFDREILEFVETNDVPLLFGTYDLDASGEYNSAALVDPARGVLGHYRKTHPFPFTEHVPTWLDGPLLRRLLPWTGGWQAGAGARVLPLRSADGREVDVLPLICLDDVHSQLAIDGARLGAQAILGLSNDSWFTGYPDGARLHLTVAAFRSIETRLPQLRVTTNGLSAIIDETGEIVATTEMGQQAVLVGEIPVRSAMSSPLVQSGDWVGRAGLLGLAVLGLRWFVLRQLALRSGTRDLPSRDNAALGRADPGAGTAFSAEVILLSPLARIAIGLLRLLAALGLLGLGISMLRGDGLQVSSLAQIEQFALTVALPLLVAWALQRACVAKASVVDGFLRFAQSAQDIEIPLASISRLGAWRLPLPAAGVDLVLGSGRRFDKGLATRDAQRLLLTLQASGSPASWSDGVSAQIAEHAGLRAAAARPALDHFLTKFVLLPLVPALIAFHLHQNIAFGGPFGELLTYGFLAWATGLLIWWASWVIGMMMLAAALRAAIEFVALATWPFARHRANVRRWLEDAARGLYCLGVPIWLLSRILVG